jgi:hypothetical protein
MTHCDPERRCELRPLVQVDECYFKLLDKWSMKLGGFDVFGRSDCYSMYKHVQLELKL